MDNLLELGLVKDIKAVLHYSKRSCNWYRNVGV